MLHLYSHHIHVTFRIPLIHYPLFCLVKCMYRVYHVLLSFRVCMYMCKWYVYFSVWICLLNESEMLFSLNTNYQHGSLRHIESLRVRDFRRKIRENSKKDIPLHRIYMYTRICIRAIRPIENKKKNIEFYLCHINNNVQ